MANAPRHGLRFSARHNEPPPEGDIVIRQARVEDAQSAMEAFNASFGLHRSPEYWSQKFASPHGPISTLAVDATGRVHGQFAGYQAPFRNGGRSETILFAADVFARRSAAAIRKGLFLQLFKHFCAEQTAADHYPGMMGFPNAVAMGLYQQTGLIAHVSEIIEFHLARENAEMPTPTGLFSRLRSWRRGNFEVRSFENISNEFLSAANFVLKARDVSESVVEFERSPSWLRWRYATVGEFYGAYVFHLVLMRSRPVAWFVTRRIDNELYLIDWRCAQTAEDESAILCRGFSDILLRSGAARAVAMMTSNLRASLGAHLGWQPGSIVPFAMVRLRPWTVDFSALRLNYGDTDLR